MSIVNKKLVYKILFQQDDSIVELYAKHVSEAEMFGFIAIEDLLFGETSSVVVDPAEERLKEQFKDVKCTFVPMHSILRIDEVEKEGISKIQPLPKGGSKVSSITTPLYRPKGEPRGQD